MDPDMLNLAQFIVSELQAMMIPGKSFNNGLTRSKSHSLTISLLTSFDMPSM